MYDILIYFEVEISYKILGFVSERIKIKNFFIKFKVNFSINHTG